METKESIRAKRKYLADSNRRYGAIMQRVPRDDWPKLNQSTIKVAEVWRSRWFLVQVWYEDLGMIRLSVCRTEIKSDGQFKDDISWEDLQRLKGEVGFKQNEAVEVYPADKDVVNVANMRHLWVFPTHVERLPFIWRAKENHHHHAHPITDQTDTGRSETRGETDRTASA